MKWWGGLALVLTSSCSLLTPTPRGVTLINESTDALTLTLEADQVSLLSGESQFLPREGSVHLAFSVDDGATTYTVDTGYTEDYSAYSLRFLGSPGALRCELVHSWDGVRPLELVRPAETSPSR